MVKQSAQVEAKLAHDVTRALVKACVLVASESPAPASWLAGDATDATSRHAPVARGDASFAVNRAERAVLEAACATYLSFLNLEGLVEEPLPGAESAAQAAGLLLMQWIIRNKPYAFAANNLQDKIPGET